MFLSAKFLYRHFLTDQHFPSTFSSTDQYLQPSHILWLFFHPLFFPICVSVSQKIYYLLCVSWQKHVSTFHCVLKIVMGHTDTTRAIIDGLLIYKKLCVFKM